MGSIKNIKKYGLPYPNPLCIFLEGGGGGQPHPKIGVLTPSLTNYSKGLFWPWELFCSDVIKNRQRHFDGDDTWD